MRASGRWHAGEEQADHDSAPDGAPDIRSVWAFQLCALGFYGVVLWMRSGTGEANPESVVLAAVPIAALVCGVAAIVVHLKGADRDAARRAPWAMASWFIAEGVAISGLVGGFVLSSLAYYLPYALVAAGLLLWMRPRSEANPPSELTQPTNE